MSKNFFGSLVAMIGVVAALSGCSKSAPPAPSAQGPQADGGGGELTAEAPPVASQVPSAAAPTVATPTADAGASAASDSDQDAGPSAAARGADGGVKGFSHWDKNGDGKISKDEAPAKLKARFDKVDTNHDGAIDPQEFAARSSGKGHAKGHGKGKGHGQGGRHKDGGADPSADETTEP